MNGSVTIINYNINAHNIVSAAGRISTTRGCADEIYEKSCKNEAEDNIKLIKKILASGHESILEHIFFNLSFDSVSVFVEQFMIEFRLASFTVKSRRYVDFSKMGYVSPDFTKYGADHGEYMKCMYEKHMEYLFGEYQYFVEMGIPKEDARFVLPYSFKSNFYCTVNARELLKIMEEMVYGRGEKYQELVMLGQSLMNQCEKEFPYLKPKKSQIDIRNTIKKYFKEAVPVPSERWRSDALVSLISETPEPEKIICRAAALNYGIDHWDEIDLNDTDSQKKIIGELLKHSRKRELEQANFTVLFNRISLAGVTHLVRHRMQSIVIPEYISVCDFDHYIVPQTAADKGLTDRYKMIFEKSKSIAQNLNREGFDLSDQVYMLLSGMTIPVMTTMNGNELYTFIRLRTCNRAQWEIKECGDRLLELLREKYPVLFSMFGPSCYSVGRCPEGKMTCGLMEEVCRSYSI